MYTMIAFEKNIFVSINHMSQAYFILCVKMFYSVAQLSVYYCKCKQFCKFLVLLVLETIITLSTYF